MCRQLVMYGYNATGEFDKTEGVGWLCRLVKVEMVVVRCRQSLYILGYDTALMAYPQPQYKATYEPIDQSEGYWEPSVDDQKRLEVSERL